ncbi:THAP domain-containing protein 6-like [Centroberyx gerrardi]|uniref:THAP domain-containing protein 6-like n=1 Tax=Centroberyx gerrardi TaxID=166262 RepID=UPI003AAAE25B
MAESRNKSFCSVPKCSNSKQKQPYLIFHLFPVEVQQRRQWIHAIKRDEGPFFTVRRGSTCVCSMHITQADYQPSSSRLKIGAVPSLFQWNNYGAPPSRETAYARANARLGVDVREAGSESGGAAAVQVMDHDYASHPPPGALDNALQYTEELEARLQKISLNP